MMTHDEMIAVITHHKNGGRVEHNAITNLRAESGWLDMGGDWQFNFELFDYRAKPEPLVLWAVCVEESIFATFRNEAEASAHASAVNLRCPNVTLKKLVEVSQ